MFLSKIVCVFVVSRPLAGWHFCNILDFKTHNNNLFSRHALTPIPRCSHVYLSDIPWSIRQRRRAQLPSVGSVCTVARVDMPHDRYGSYWKLTAVCGADGKCNCGIVKLLCCQNICEIESAVTSLWLMAFLHEVLKTDCNKNILIRVWLKYIYIYIYIYVYIYRYQC